MTNTQESAKRLWWSWWWLCLYWRWRKWCRQQNLLTLGRSWTLGVIRGLLITPPAVTWVHIVIYSPSSCISLSNFRLNLWFLEITEQVNLIIDGQSSINNQIYLFGNFSKFLSWKNLIAARWDTWVVYCDGSGYKLARVFLAVTNLAVKVRSLFVCLSCMKTLIDST